MSRDPRVFLDDIVEASDRIAAYLAGVDRDAFGSGFAPMSRLGLNVIAL